MKKNKHNVTLAQLLRDAGWTLEEIGTEVGVSYATVSLWLLTPEQYAVRKEARKEHSRRYYEANKETERERSVKRRKSDPSYKRRYYKANKGAIRESNCNYRAANKEALNERKRKHYEANKEAISERNRERYEENKEARREYGRKRYEENKEARREYGRKYYEANPEKAREWRQANPEKVKSSKALRRQKVEAYKPSKVEQVEIERIYASAGLGDHVDHIYPIARGGAHHPWNLKVLTAKQNMKKGAKILPNTSPLIEIAPNSFVPMPLWMI